MTKIKDLIATLGTRNPDAKVFMMTAGNQPYENYLAGVVDIVGSDAGFAADLLVEHVLAPEETRDRSPEERGPGVAVLA